MKSKSTLILGALGLALLAGCADTSGSKGATPAGTASSSTSSSQTSQPSTGTSTTSAPAPQSSTPRAAVGADGTVAEFDKQSAELSSDALANIASLVDAATQAQRVEVTGFCDRKDDEKNAKQLALTRAVAVRSELIKHGVPAKIIRTKYVTTEARHAVTVVLK